MEARPEREVSSLVGEVQIASKVSNDLGETWSDKEIIDDPERLLLGNPYVLTDQEGKLNDLKNE